MSRGKIVKCDQCGHREEYFEGTIGRADFIRWIYVTRAQSRSDDIVGAGEYTFCGDHCLKEFMNGKR